MTHTLEKKVTIGIPVYNEEKTLSDTLTSAIDSASCMGVGYEAIVCFNGTTDNGRDVAERIKESYPLKIEIIESTKGKPSALQAIVEKSRGNYLLFCDGDVIVEEDCFSQLIKNFEDDEVMAVTGCPKPYDLDNLLYKVLNARMRFPYSEIARNPTDGNSEKPFIHGRIYALRREVFGNQKIADNFEKSIGDDTFLTHLIIQQYGRNAIVREHNARVQYLPVQTLQGWWHKWSRIWEDIEKLYKDNPEFKELRSVMETKLDWDYILKQPLPTPLFFATERAIHYVGRTYFNLTKGKNRGWKRLSNTKRTIKK